VDITKSDMHLQKKFQPESKLRMEICNTKSKIHQPVNEIYRSAEQYITNVLEIQCNTSIGYQLNTIINQHVK
jgi:hypothetical protein